MRSFDDLSMAEREAYIADAQAYLRAEVTELKIPFVTAECHKEILSIAERCEMDRDWIEDRLSFVRSGL
jgi:hypothetical protein